MTVRELTEKDAEDICGWRYAPPYNVYNLPDWETAKRNHLSLSDPEKRGNEYFAVADISDSRPAGYFRLVRRDGFVMLGLGLRPELCGAGRGARLMSLALGTSARLYGSLPVRLEVREFNTRAVRCYLRAGFIITGRRVGTVPSGDAEFIMMEYRAEKTPEVTE